MKTDCHPESQFFELLRDEWNTLLHRSTADTVFNTWEWHSQWWAAYHPGELWGLAVRDSDGRLTGIASLFVETTSEGKRLLHFVGCEDVTDYLDVIAECGQEEAVAQALAEWFWAHRAAFDGFDLCNIPQHSTMLPALVNALKVQGFTIDVEQQEVCPVIKLPSQFEVYLDSLESKQGRELRRKLRRAEGQGDAMGWYIVSPEHDIEAEIDRFLHLMALSHPQKAQFLTDTAHVAFFRSIVPIARDRGWLQLCFLTVNRQAVASYLNFDYGNRILIYNSGLDPDKFGALSPGIVLLAYTIQHAIEQGRETFDFLRGDEQYKYRMGAVNTSVYKLSGHALTQ